MRLFIFRVFRQLTCMTTGKFTLLMSEINLSTLRKCCVIVTTFNVLMLVFAQQFLNTGLVDFRRKKTAWLMAVKRWSGSYAGLLASAIKIIK